MGSLCSVIQSNAVLYAEDISLIELFRKNKPSSDNITTISIWMRDNNFVFNLTKSKRFIFILSSLSEALYYPSIELVNDIKLLGIY